MTDDRAAFEAWASDKGFNLEWFDGCYVYERTCDTFWAWKGACAAKDKEIARLRQSELDFYRAAMSLLGRYNPFNMPEDDSQQWQQLADACLRSRAALKETE